MKREILTTLVIGGMVAVAHADPYGKDITNNKENFENYLQETDDGMKKRSFAGMIDSEEMLDAEIFNMNDEEIGQVDRLVINAKTRQIEHVIVSVGGFLGISERLIAIPFDQFQAKQVWDPEDIERAHLDTETVNVSELDYDSPAAGNTPDIETESQAEIVRYKLDTPEETPQEQIRDEAEIRLYVDATRERLMDAPRFNPENDTSQLDSVDARRAVSDFWRGEDDVAAL